MNKYIEYYKFYKYLKFLLALIFLLTFIFLILLQPLNVFAYNINNNNYYYHYGWGFRNNNDHTPPEIGKYKEEIANTDAFYIGDSLKHNIYLTFDAGYDNGNLASILDILQEKEVQATFFITGDFLNRCSDLVKRIANEGHLVGNHTWHHYNITKLNKQELEKEIKQVEDKYYEITNKEINHFFRPPEGEFNHQSLENVKAIGYKTIFWSLAYKDWDTKHQHGKDYAYNSVMNKIHNGAIILMHTVSTDNKEALPYIIDELRNQGYIFSSLNDFN